MEKTEKYIDNLGRKITVHYFTANAQYEIEGKPVKHVVSEKKLDAKKLSDKWRRVA